jgi:hypothetical protein
MVKSERKCILNIVTDCEVQQWVILLYGRPCVTSGCDLARYLSVSNGYKLFYSLNFVNNINVALLGQESGLCVENRQE